MLRFAIWLALAGWMFAPPATAQQVTVQLPSFRVFGASTTVVVPDRGAVSLGGVSRSSSGRVSRGAPLVGRLPGANRLFNNRAVGHSAGASNISVTATIIDNHELDQAVLAEARARRGAPPAANPADAKALYLSQHVGGAGGSSSNRRARSTDQDNTLQTVASIRQRNAAAQERRVAECREYCQRGRKAEGAGNHGAARVYYQMALRRAEGELRRQIGRRLSIVSGDAAQVATRP